MLRDDSSVKREHKNGNDFKKNEAFLEEARTASPSNHHHSRTHVSPRNDLLGFVKELTRSGKRKFQNIERTKEGKSQYFSFVEFPFLSLYFQLLQILSDPSPFKVSPYLISQTAVLISRRLCIICSIR